MAETGVAPAIVVDVRDPKGLGRVRVRYPWHERPDDGYWARVVAPLGAPAVGAAAEVGQEVLVAFERGDLRAPYVVGGLWSSSRPPLPAGGAIEVLLPAGGITLRDAHGNRLTIEGGASGITVRASGAIVVKAAEITVEGSGPVRVRSSASLTLAGAVVHVN
jgi:hypothetical protein